MSLLSRKSLAKRLLKTKKFRDGFVSARIMQTLALQARAMREERDLSQTQLAKDLDTSQNAIYRLENPGYGKSISTLMKVASFFDVGLVVRFERFSGIVDWVSDMDSESILVPPADKDARLKQAASGAAELHIEGTRSAAAIPFRPLTERGMERAVLVTDEHPLYSPSRQSTVAAFLLGHLREDQLNLAVGEFLRLLQNEVSRRSTTTEPFPVEPTTAQPTHIPSRTSHAA
jgi:DNA-binding XRE family transcriptional regulator